MKQLKDFKDRIRKCSKCGLCQAECPVYKATGNDCTVSKGHFIMLKGFLNGDLKLSKTLNRYLDLCLKCGACSKFCPGGIDVVDVIAAAKSEYFKTSLISKLFSFIQKYFIFGLFLNISNIFSRKIKGIKSDKKMLYFGGCRSKLKGNNAVVKILNNFGIEVITPCFCCCGIPFFMRGDFDGFNSCINKYVKILKKYNITEVVTTCASCEKTIKNYIKWVEDKETKEFLQKINIRNIYSVIRENNPEIKLKKTFSVTFHKPCNLDNFSDIEWILKNTENLNYIEMEGFNECCGLNGIFKFKEYCIIKKIFKQKRENIIKTKTKYVLTSCPGCETALGLYSFNSYKTGDLLKFIANRI